MTSHADRHAATANETILIHGGNNQVAESLLRALADRQERVVVISRSGAAPASRASTTVRWLSQLNDDDPACPQVRTLIWIGPFEGLEQTMARLPGLVRVMAFSSSSLDNKADSNDPREQQMLDALRDGEQRLRAHCTAAGVAWTLFRPTLIYGLGRDRNLTRLARMIDRFGVLFLPASAQGLRQPVHAGDLAQAALAAMRQPAGCSGLYSLGGADQLPYREMVSRIFVSLDRPVRIITVPVWLIRLGLWCLRQRKRHADLNIQMVHRMARDLIVDHQPAVRDLGYAPRPFRPDRQTWSTADDVGSMALSDGSE